MGTVKILETKCELFNRECGSCHHPRVSRTQVKDGPQHLLCSGSEVSLNNGKFRAMCKTQHFVAALFQSEKVGGGSYTGKYVICFNRECQKDGILTRGCLVTFAESIGNGQKNCSSETAAPLSQTWQQGSKSADRSQTLDQAQKDTNGAMAGEQSLEVGAQVRACFNDPFPRNQAAQTGFCMHEWCVGHQRRSDGTQYRLCWSCHDNIINIAE